MPPARGQQTGPEIQWAVVRLSRHLDLERIATCLDISLRTVKQILVHFRAYGTIPNPSEDAAPRENTGNHHLRDVDVDVKYRATS